MELAHQSHSFGMPWESGYGFAQAIQVGPTVYISGQLSHDMEANFVGVGTSSSKYEPRSPISTASWRRMAREGSTWFRRPYT
jgi:hypothetical protein